MTSPRALPLAAAAPAALLLGLLLAGCSDGASEDASTPAPTETAAQDPTQSPTEAPTTPSKPGDLEGPAATPACAEVRSGISAFNAGDYDATVAHFVDAVPLARDQARADASAEADDLLEAVRYYARLAPEDYRESSLSSADFERYKQITLGQCVPSGGPPPPASEEPPVIA